MIQLIFFPSIFRMYNQGKKTVIRMLGKYNPSDNKHSLQGFLFPVAVVVAFFICWIPFHSQRLMFVVVTLYREWTVGLQQATYVCLNILFASSWLCLRPNTCSSWCPVCSTTLTPSSTRSCTPSCPSASGGASMTWRAPAVRSGWENNMMRNMRKYQP